MQFSSSCHAASFALQVAEGLMQQLGVPQESLVTGAYVDLILDGRQQT